MPLQTQNLKKNMKGANKGKDSVWKPVIKYPLPTIPSTITGWVPQCDSENKRTRSPHCLNHNHRVMASVNATMIR